MAARNYFFQYIYNLLLLPFPVHSMHSALYSFLIWLLLFGYVQNIPYFKELHVWSYLIWTVKPYHSQYLLILKLYLDINYFVRWWTVLLDRQTWYDPFLVFPRESLWRILHKRKVRSLAVIMISVLESLTSWSVRITTGELALTTVFVKSQFIQLFCF